MGITVAFIGMTLEGTPTIVSPSGVAGLTFKDEADTVNALVPSCAKEGVKAIVVLVHQGGFQGATSSPAGTTDKNFVNDCKDARADPEPPLPPRQMAFRSHDAVDVVISGHLPPRYTCVLPKKSGRLIHSTQLSAGVRPWSRPTSIDDHHGYGEADMYRPRGLT